MPKDRSLRLLDAGRVRIRVGDEVTIYRLQCWPSEDGQHLTLLRWTKPDGENYVVAMGPAPELSTCECLGYLRWGHCKHIKASFKMLEQGRLPRPTNVGENHAAG